MGRAELRCEAEFIVNNLFGVVERPHTNGRGHAGISAIRTHRKWCDPFTSDKLWLPPIRCPMCRSQQAWGSNFTASLSFPGSVYLTALLWVSFIQLSENDEYCNHRQKKTEHFGHPRCKEGPQSLSTNRTSKWLSHGCFPKMFPALVLHNRKFACLCRDLTEQFYRLRRTGVSGTATDILHPKKTQGVNNLAEIDN